MNNIISRINDHQKEEYAQEIPKKLDDSLGSDKSYDTNIEQNLSAKSNVNSERNIEEYVNKIQSVLQENKKIKKDNEFKSNSLESSISKKQENNDTTMVYNLEELPENKQLIIPISNTFPKKVKKLIVNLKKIPIKDDIIAPSSNKKMPEKIKQLYIDEIKPIVSPITISESSNERISSLINRTLRNQNCIKVETMTKKWRKIFPKGTVEFVFDNKYIPCNFIILKVILKQFRPDLFSDVSTYTLKKMLIHFYQKYTNKKTLLQQIIKTWKHANNMKSDLAVLLKKGKDISTIVMDETYQLTETDISLFAWEVKLPIIFMFASKNSIKSFSFKQEKSVVTGKYFFIRISRNKLYLCSSKNSILIDPNVLQKDSELEYAADPMEELLKNKFINFEDYLMSKK